MTKIKLEIQDEKLDFFKELIENFSFVEVLREESDKKVVNNSRPDVEEKVGKAQENK